MSLAGSLLESLRYLLTEKAASLISSRDLIIFARSSKHNSQTVTIQNKETSLQSWSWIIASRKPQRDSWYLQGH